MPYIGRAPSKSGSFSIIDDISSGFNASTVAFTLQKSGSNMNVVRDATLLIAVDGVMQEPGTAFTVSGSTITFGSAPLTGASFWGVELGDVGGIAEANALTANAVTSAADLGAAPATADTLVVHDASAAVLKEMTVANLFTAPAITGNATATTQTSGNDSTRIATTAFVQAAVTGDFQIAVTQASHGLSVGQAVKVTGNDTYATAQADSAANAEVVGIVTSVSGNDFTLTLNGEIATGGSISAANVAAGTVLFLSQTTAGLLTPTEPSTADEISKPVALVTAQDARMVLLHYRGEIVSTGVQTDAPNDANYLIGTANSGLTAEIVVGTAPGGELGNTWASPTVDSNHGGSAHHADAHTVVSHSDTTATGEELETLTDGSTTTLHAHASASHGASSHTDIAKSYFISAMGANIDSGFVVVNAGRHHGLRSPDNTQSTCTFTGRVPDDFESFTSIKVLWETPASSGNLVFQGYFYWAGADEADSTNAETGDSVTVATGGAEVFTYTEMGNVAMSGIAAKDIFGCDFRFNRNSGSDTLGNTATIVGWEFNYVATQ